MDDWETELAGKLNSEYIDLKYIDRQGHVGSNYYKNTSLELDIYNSKRLLAIQHNKRIFEKECDSIKVYMQNLLPYIDIPHFETIKINVKEQRGFWIFGRHETKTVNYNVN
tara:strand:- start:1486 stop:1818 length:333 start_codon:yes stop_codon:yes gene_type:complete